MAKSLVNLAAYVINICTNIKYAKKCDVIATLILILIL